MIPAKSLSLAAILIGLAAASAAEAAPPYISVCHNFGCSLQTRVDFTPQDMAALRAVVVAGRADPKAERAALGRAVQWFERRVGPVVGTSKDVGGFEKAMPSPDQQDCIDESTNTTRLLTMIDKQGWLTWHRVGRKAVRGYLVDGRYPHNTAVVVEKKSATKWAIDSWTHANAEPPDIMPLSKWLKKGRRWFRAET